MYSIRQNAAELKRQDILINKTREEVAKEYVTKSEVKDDMNNLMDRLEKLDEKIDRLFEIK
jgi:archaellum component FlaC